MMIANGILRRTTISQARRCDIPLANKPDHFLCEKLKTQFGLSRYIFKMAAEKCFLKICVRLILKIVLEPPREVFSQKGAWTYSNLDVPQISKTKLQLSSGNFWHLNCVSLLKTENYNCGNRRRERGRRARRGATFARVSASCYPDGPRLHGITKTQINNKFWK